MRHGAGRGRLAQPAAKRRLPLPGRRHLLAGRALPRLRCPGRRHAAGQRRGHCGAQAPGRCAARRRHHPRRHPGQRRQQRWRRQGGLHGARRQRPGRRGARGAGPGGRAGRHHRLCGSPWHGHGAGRPHRDRGADPGLSRQHAAQGLLRHRLGEDQYRPSRCGSRCHGPDQGGALAQACHLAAQPAFRAAASADRLRAQSLPCQHRGQALAPGGHAAPRGRERLRHWRHQCPCGAAGGCCRPCHLCRPFPYTGGCSPGLAGAAAVRSQPPCAG